MPKYHSRTELAVVTELKNCGEKFRTQGKHLPGTPDIYFAKEKIVVFVHGCYWHRHADCRGRRTPRKNLLTWIERFNMQVLIDQKNYKKLRNRGWWIYTAWECEINQNVTEVVSDLLRYLTLRRT